MSVLKLIVTLLRGLLEVAPPCWPRARHFPSNRIA